MAKGFLRDGGVGMKTGCESLGMDLDERAGVAVGVRCAGSQYSLFFGIFGT